MMLLRYYYCIIIVNDSFALSLFVVVCHKDTQKVKAEFLLT